ncbi:MAG TPA: rhodanese-like domain-containing protein [Candidatus Nanopelagicales bacterium]
MIEQIGPEELAGRLGQPGVTLLDVREVHEFQGGHVPGAVNIPMSLLPLRVGEVPASGELLVICHTGGRSMQVCQWLAQQGRTAANVSGGTAAWMAHGRPLEA